MSYRLIRFADAKRVLFLVDRANLGRQTLKEFQAFETPDDRPQVHRALQRPAPRLERHRPRQPGHHHDDPASLLDRSGASRSSTEEYRRALAPTSLVPDEPLPVVYNPSVPIETFDVIIVDECHRSIYGALAPGLDYFDAFLDRPDGDAEQADVRVLQPEPGDGVQPRAGGRRRRQRRLRRLPHPHRDHRAAAAHRRRARDGVPRPRRRAQCAGRSSTRTSTYDAEALDRAVVAKDQIRTVIRTFKERLFTEISPAAPRCPKTLIFAKDDSPRRRHRPDRARGVRQGQRLRHQDHLPARPAASPRSCSPRSATPTTRASPSPST